MNGHPRWQRKLLPADPGFASHLCTEQLSQWRDSPLAVADCHQSALCPSEKGRGLGQKAKGEKQNRISSWAEEAPEAECISLNVVKYIIVM